MPMQKRIAFVGLSKQTAKGAAATSPATFGFGIRGGGVLQAGLEQESDAITYASRISPDENRTAVNPGAVIPARLWPRSGGLLLYGALGGIVTTGSGPYTHTITPAATLPYLTVFSQFDTEYHKLADCTVDTLGINWSERAPVETEVTVKGVTWTGYTGSWTATNDEATQNKFIPPGGTFGLHASSGTPGSTAAITAGSITINNNLVPVPLSKAITPDDNYPAEQTIDVSFTLMPADTLEFRRALTGADGGTTFTGNPVFGSFSVAFVDGANTCTITGTRVAFFPEYPEADPGGGPAELTMVGRVKKPAAAALTAVMVNTTVSY
jgi:hypothetical protein